MLRDRLVDIVVSDFPLPDMPGITILEKISRLYPSLPIIAITTNQLTSQEIDHIEELVQTFLKKPFEIQRLEKIIKDILNP
jgi:DNA-binding NtrC family response regulator